VPLVNSILRTEQPEERTIQSFIMAPENFGISSGVFSISPDGHYLAFAGVVPGNQLLWVRPLGDVGWRSLAATEGATFPFWSPDSRSLAFFANGKLKKDRRRRWTTTHNL
jgi:Tol biopolymer transport system component